VTIEITKGSRRGQVLTNAHWFGFNWWVRVWVAEPDGSGWLHYPSSEFRVVKP
jgi:hypothetical protein